MRRSSRNGTKQLRPSKLEPWNGTEKLPFESSKWELIRKQNTQLEKEIEAKFKKIAEKEELLSNLKTNLPILLEGKKEELRKKEESIHQLRIAFGLPAIIEKPRSPPPPAADLEPPMKHDPMCETEDDFKEIKIENGEPSIQKEFKYTTGEASLFKNFKIEEEEDDRYSGMSFRFEDEPMESEPKTDRTPEAMAKQEGQKAEVDFCGQFLNAGEATDRSKMIQQFLSQTFP